MTLYSLYLRVLKSQFVVLRSNHWHFQFRLLKLGSWQNHDKPRQQRAKRLHNSCRFRINCGRPLWGVWAKCEVNERTRTEGRMTFFLSSFFALLSWGVCLIFQHNSGRNSGGLRRTAKAADGFLRINLLTASVFAAERPPFIESRCSCVPSASLGCFQLL